MEYILTAKKKDWNIWKDFVRVNSRHLEYFQKASETGDEIQIKFKPYLLHQEGLFRAFRDEKEMETEFKIEVAL